jgi:hypothetical protein
LTFWKIGVSSFLSTRSRAFHIRNPEIAKREEVWRSGFRHFGISEIRGPEGIRDREFEDKPYELLVREIAITVGLRGRTTTVDFLGSGTLVFRCFGIQHIGNPVDKGTRHSAKEIPKS